MRSRRRRTRALRTFTMPWKIAGSVDCSWVVEPERSARRIDHKLDRSAVRIEAGYHKRQTTYHGAEQV